MTRQRFDCFVVQTQIQNRIHHARHGNARTRTHRYQQRIFHVCKFFAHNAFNVRDTVTNLVHQIRWICMIVFIVICAHFCCNGKARRHRQSDQIHFGQIGTFAPQKVTHIRFTFGGTVTKFIYPFITHMVFSLVFKRPALCEIWHRNARKKAQFL